jgi:hypothetical protein
MSSCLEENPSSFRSNTKFHIFIFVTTSIQVDDIHYELKTEGLFLDLGCGYMGFHLGGWDLFCFVLFFAFFFLTNMYLSFHFTLDIYILWSVL